MGINIIIADDHRIIRDGLSKLLDKDDSINVIGQAANGREAFNLAKEKTPDIVIMDIGMPVMNGIESTRQIVSELPNTKIIALSMHYDKQFVLGMLKAGVKGYLLKDCAGSELVNAIKTVYNNNTYFNQDITNMVINDDSEINLTNREKEVLQLLAEGNSTKQIASELYISVKTVEAHRANIMQKIKISNLPGLTKYAIRNGYTSIDL